MRRGELLEREKGKLTKSNDAATPHVFATMSWLVFTYRGDLGWGQVKGHLQGLVLIETIESTSWSAALFYGIEL